MEFPKKGDFVKLANNHQNKAARYNLSVDVSYIVLRAVSGATGLGLSGINIKNDLGGIDVFPTYFFDVVDPPINYIKEGLL